VTGFLKYDTDFDNRLTLTNFLTLYRDSCIGNSLKVSNLLTKLTRLSNTVQCFVIAAPEQSYINVLCSYLLTVSQTATWRWRYVCRFAQQHVSCAVAVLPNQGCAEPCCDHSMLMQACVLAV
jgi:hypothetical protein